MALGSVSLLLASTLALSPFSTPWTVRAADDGAWPNSGGGSPSEKPAAEVPDPAAPSTATPGTTAPGTTAPGTEPTQDPSWDEPEATEPGATGTGTTEPTPTTTPTDPATGTTVPPAALPPGMTPAPMIVTRPAPPTGLGLMIGAGVTGGLGWVVALARLSALNKCKSAIGTAVLDNGQSGASAFGQCFTSGVSMYLLTPVGYLVNDVTYGLAPAAGVFRGRYDGTNAAWDGKPNRPAPVLIGVGAGLLAGGIVGRVATFVAFWRQLNPDRLFSNYPLGAHFVLTQVAAASIQAGGGLLGYGLAYKKARSSEESRRKAAGLAKKGVDLELAPQLGWSYNGLALTGRF